MRYELRCYQKSSHNPDKHDLINVYPVLAESDQEAIDAAPNIDVQAWENTDLAILFNEDERVLWLIR